MTAECVEVPQSSRRVGDELEKRASRRLLHLTEKQIPRANPALGMTLTFRKE